MPSTEETHDTLSADFHVTQQEHDYVEAVLDVCDETYLELSRHIQRSLSDKKEGAYWSSFLQENTIATGSYFKEKFTGEYNSHPTLQLRFTSEDAKMEFCDFFSQSKNQCFSVKSLSRFSLKAKKAQIMINTELPSCQLSELHTISVFNTDIHGYHFNSGSYRFDYNTFKKHIYFTGDQPPNDQNTDADKVKQVLRIIMLINNGWCIDKYTFNNITSTLRRGFDQHFEWKVANRHFPEFSKQRFITDTSNMVVVPSEEETKSVTPKKKKMVGLKTYTEARSIDGAVSPQGHSAEQARSYQEIYDGMREEMMEGSQEAREESVINRAPEQVQERIMREYTATIGDAISRSRGQVEANVQSRNTPNPTWSSIETQRGDAWMTLGEMSNALSSPTAPDED